jgi:REP element-mobilizing transposase RayT
MSVLRDVPNLRRRQLVRLFERAVLESHRPEAFRIVHYGLMHDHFHLIVEAHDRVAIARGMQRLNIRIARRVNKVVGRRGRCFADRYHRRDVRTPLEARRALRYVLLNRQIWLARRGREREQRGIDRCSSGRWFDGWMRRAPLARDGPVVLLPRTWLLRVGWRRWGRIPRPPQ